MSSYFFIPGCFDRFLWSLKNIHEGLSCIECGNWCSPYESGNKTIISRQPAHDTYMHVVLIIMNHSVTEDLLAPLLPAAFPCHHNTRQLRATERGHGLCPQLRRMKIQNWDINYANVRFGKNTLTSHNFEFISEKRKEKVKIRVDFTEVNEWRLESNVHLYHKWPRMSDKANCVTSLIAFIAAPSSVMQTANTVWIKATLRRVKNTHTKLLQYRRFTMSSHWLTVWQQTSANLNTSFVRE